MIPCSCLVVELHLHSCQRSLMFPFAQPTLTTSDWGKPPGILPAGLPSFISVYWDVRHVMGFPWWLGGREPTCQCRRHKRRGCDPWLGRSPGVGNGDPLQCSCLGNPKDGGDWQAFVNFTRLWNQVERLKLGLSVTWVHTLWATGKGRRSHRTHEVFSQFSSVAQLRPTLCDPMACSMPASLPVTKSRSLLRLKSIKSVMPSNHLILCPPLLLPPSIFPSIRVFSSESVLCIRQPKYWSFSFSISPSNEFRTDFL